MSKKLNIKILRLPHGEGIPLPKYMSHSASGMDLYAAVENEIVLAPGERALVPTGFKMALPEGYEAQVRPRSGLAIKNGISVLNTPGTIDEDYRGEVGVILINHGREDFKVKRGDRIAQMVINKVEQAGIEEVEILDETHRSSGGFGHTGI
jgi:dUTP pyrophosphatase